MRSPGNFRTPSPQRGPARPLCPATEGRFPESPRTFRKPYQNCMRHTGYASNRSQNALGAGIVWLLVVIARPTDEGLQEGNLGGRSRTLLHPRRAVEDVLLACLPACLMKKSVGERLAFSYIPTLVPSAAGGRTLGGFGGASLPAHYRCT
ncbi:MAG: hypothetical protein FD153_1570 [Rhodospirillaceae bacterium]|nr:MAG: hypothetical protein FD153_1570 [Rhodospirillaceae bacterium]